MTNREQAELVAKFRTPPGFDWRDLANDIETLLNAKDRLAMDPLQHRKLIVWNNSPPKRYIPRSLDGGTGWGVWDAKVDRFLTDAHVMKIPKDTLLAETVTN